MHPRNIYKDSARAIGHAEKDPLVAQFIIQDKNKKRFNSLDDRALRQLSKILLREDFDLDIDFPPLALIPTIPLRLNYILWLEDLLHDFDPCSYREGAPSSPERNYDEKIRGIDIGTGGSAIYAILAARKNNWLMVGSETNPESVDYAKSNVNVNNLGERVTVLKVDPPNYFDLICSEHPEITFDFSMCNPPFFGSAEETDPDFKSRTDHRPLPPNEKTGTGAELFVEGGELKFVSDMIMESLRFKTRVRIYTTMVGVKAHLPALIKLLKEHQIPNITMTEFVQGRTRRWGLAWSFYHNHKTSYRNSVPGKLANAWIMGVPNPAKPIQAVVSMRDQESTLLQTIVQTMFKELNLQLVDSSHTEDEVELEYVGFENTWSNMRRKRREQARAMQQKERPSEEESKSQKLLKTNEGQTVSQASLQDVERKDSGFKHFECCDCSSGLVHFVVVLKPLNLAATEATLVHIQGTLGPEGVHQVFQYMKNCLQKHEKVENVTMSH